MSPSARHVCRMSSTSSSVSGRGMRVGGRSLRSRSRLWNGHWPTMYWTGVRARRLATCRRNVSFCDGVKTDSRPLPLSLDLEVPRTLDKRNSADVHPSGIFSLSKREVARSRAISTVHSVGKFNTFALLRSIESPSPFDAARHDTSAVLDFLGTKDVVSQGGRWTISHLKLLNWVVCKDRNTEIDFKPFVLAHDLSVSLKTLYERNNITLCAIATGATALAGLPAMVCSDSAP